MELEKQVCSFELAKELKELGVKQDSLFYWIPSSVGYILTSSFVDILSDQECNIYLETIKKTIPDKIYSAFTVAELGEILPGFLLEINLRIFKNNLDEFCITYGNYSIIFHDKNESNARAKMLIHLIKNELIKVGKL